MNFGPIVYQKYTHILKLKVRQKSNEFFLRRRYPVSPLPLSPWRCFTNLPWLLASCYSACRFVKSYFGLECWWRNENTATHGGSFSLSHCKIYLCNVHVSVYPIHKCFFPRCYHSSREYSFGKRGAQAEVSLSNLLFMPPHFDCSVWVWKWNHLTVKGAITSGDFTIKGVGGFTWDARRMFFAT